MKTRDEVIAILRDLKAEAAPRFGLFGSYARDEQSEQSDLGLLVEFERPVPFNTFCRLETATWKGEAGRICDACYQREIGRAVEQGRPVTLTAQ